MSGVSQAQRRQIAAQLLAQSEEFALWWETTGPLLNPVHDKAYEHPEVGPLRIFQTVTSVMGAPELAIVHMTPRDEETRAKFALLAQRASSLCTLPAEDPERLVGD